MGESSTNRKKSGHGKSLSVEETFVDQSFPDAPCIMEYVPATSPKNVGTHSTLVLWVNIPYILNVWMSTMMIDYCKKS